MSEGIFLRRRAAAAFLIAAFFAARAGAVTPGVQRLVGPATPGASLGSVTAGSGFACGIENHGQLVCWGDNFFGETSPPPGTFTEVSAGDS